MVDAIRDGETGLPVPVDPEGMESKVSSRKNPRLDALPSKGLDDGTALRTIVRQQTKRDAGHRSPFRRALNDEVPTEGLNVPLLS